VIVNGESREVPGGQTVTGLLEHLCAPIDRVAVELNKNIVRRRDWNDTLVPDGSHVEVVEFVGGG
jgi:sulfur carrier protein